MQLEDKLDGRTSAHDGANAAAADEAADAVKDAHVRLRGHVLSPLAYQAADAKDGDEDVVLITLLIITDRPIGLMNNPSNGMVLYPDGTSPLGLNNNRPGY